jgi:hypothetical protein
VIEMTDFEIRERLKKFEDTIFSMKASEAQDVKKQLDAFVKENSVTAEQMQEFAESGAGETLYMLTC